jgi:hypothetical protein
VSDPVPLHPISRLHLDVLTDGVGILQHAIGSRPDPAHGYCVDDVARALQVDLLHWKVLGWAAVTGSAWRGLGFLSDAFDPAAGRFRNFRSIDGAWIGGLGSEDSYGRAMLALGDLVSAAPDARLVEAARTLFIRALPATHGFTSPRAEASVVLGCAAILETTPGGSPRAMLELLATRLHGRFRLRATTGWPWPEDAVTYENGLLPRALIVAGRRLHADAMTAIGLGTLDWLIEHQTSLAGHLSPIGNGWWPRDGARSQFDQQPIEATALLLAAEAAFGVAHEPRYRAAMELAYGWFLGANDVGLEVAVPERGACRDGLGANGVNRNEGAESTLMWLIAVEHIRAFRNAYPHAARRQVPVAPVLALAN